MKSRTLLKRLTDYGLSVKQIDNKIRLAPLNLINDKVLVFVRDNKEALLTALAEEYQEKNFTIGNPKPIHSCNCSLRPPFCSCIGPQVPGVTTCALCANFEPDIIGDGAGIGLCKKGILWTEEGNKRVPLYRYAERYCNIFSPISRKN